MKSFVAFIFATFFVIAMGNRPAEWAENSKQCATKNNVVEEDVKKVVTGEIKPVDVAANMKCYFLCISEKEGITKDGVFQPQALIDKVANSSNPNKMDVTKAIAACKDIKGTDNCDTAFKIMACMAQTKTNM